MQGDFHHWVDLFNHFDTFFEKFIKPRKDLQLEENFLESDPPFPRDSVLQILRVIRVILENCTNKHFYSSYEVYPLPYMSWTIFGLGTIYIYCLNFGTSWCNWFSIFLRELKLLCSKTKLCFLSIQIT